MPSSSNFLIRDARHEDQDTLVELSRQLALETEGKTLDLEILLRGVQSALADPDRLRFWVAEQGGMVVGQSAITREWSDWRNGWVWWLQSVFVKTEARGQGVFRALHQHIQACAKSDPDVIGLRLYVEQDNTSAQATYRNLGFEPGGYLVYEEMWRDRFTRKPS